MRSTKLNRRLTGRRHGEARSFLRIVGPTVLAVGLIFMIVGVGSFFSSFGSMGPPKYFWCIFVGMPLLFVGGVMTKFAYMGSVFRYVAGETAPVARDTINYMVDGTQDAVRTFAGAIRDGLHGDTGTTTDTTACPQCQASNDSTARFCDQCGGELVVVRVCGACSAENDVDARFCDSCGENL